MEQRTISKHTKLITLSFTSTQSRRLLTKKILPVRSPFLPHLMANVAKKKATSLKIQEWKNTAMVYFIIYLFKTDFIHPNFFKLPVHYYNYFGNMWNWETYLKPRMATEYGFQALPSVHAWTTAANPIGILVSTSLTINLVNLD